MSKLGATLGQQLEGALSNVVKGSKLASKTAADWYIAAAFALAFPIARFLLDKYVFEVRKGERLLERGAEAGLHSASLVAALQQAAAEPRFCPPSRPARYQPGPAPAALGPLPQIFGRRVLKVPAYKKSDDPAAIAKQNTLEKWKGALSERCCCAGLGRRFAAAPLLLRLACGCAAAEQASDAPHRSAQCCSLPPTTVEE